MLHIKIGTGLLLATLATAVGIALLGCSSHQGAPPATTEPSAEAAPEAPAAGPQLWSQICGQCHYIRSPSEFTAAEWQVIVHQMRIRAGLTGQEQRAITAFLQSAAH